MHGIELLIDRTKLKSMIDNSNWIGDFKNRKKI